MPTHELGLQHYHIRKRIHHKHEPYPHPDKLKRAYDKLIYIIVILCPIINLPQLFKIWFYHDASGVSFISWAGFSFISLAWLIYGILHKDKPIMFMNFLLMLIQAVIAAGAAIY